MEMNEKLKIWVCTLEPVLQTRNDGQKIKVLGQYRTFILTSGKLRTVPYYKLL
jgi:hypothetical protein